MADRMKKIGLNELPNDFRIVLRKPFLTKILARGKQKVGLWKRLAEELELDYTSIVDLRNDETKSISLAALKSLISITGVSLKEVERNCVYVRRTDGKPTRIPIFLTPELASLVAHAFGDGGMREKSFQVQYKNKDIQCVQDVLKAVKNIFGIEAPVIKNEKNVYIVIIPAVVGQVLCLAGAVQGNKTKKDFEVPSWIKNGTLETKRLFLRALFNDEGSVYIGKKSSNIKIFMGKLASKKNSLTNFFNSVRNMLKDFGIKSKEVRVYREYRIKGQKKLMLGFWITGKRNLKLFAKEIGFTPIKQKKLEVAIDSYRRALWDEEVRDEILCCLQKKSPQTTVELSKILNKHRSNILKHLRILEASQKITSSRYELANGIFGFSWALKKEEVM